MRNVSSFGAAALVLAVAACSLAADSGIEVGGKIGTYKATKCGGVDDGIAAGKSLCFT
jgi:hypothetical protein